MPVVATTRAEPTPQLFDGIAAERQQRILKAGVRREYRPGSTIFRESDRADRFFLVMRGAVRLYCLSEEGAKVFLFWASGGEILGGNSLLPQHSIYLANAEVVRPTTTYVWPRDVIRELALQTPRLYENALTVASKYLTWYISTHLALLCRSADERLAQTVRTLAKGFGQETEGGVRIEARNEELAAAANISPFTTSRILSRWHRKGLVAKWRGGILLRQPEKLP
jgi:CRP-like cAMP-binding protein